VIDQQFATAVYQSELTFRLRNLGYEIEAGKSGAPDVKGYTAEYLEASSPRRQQIKEAIARSGFSGPEAAQIAAHNTRDRKEIHTPSEVLAAHRQIASEFGNQAERVVVEAKERAATLTQNRVPDAPQRAQEAVSFAKDRGFEREAVTDERDIMRDALRRGMGDLTFDQVGYSCPTPAKVKSPLFLPNRTKYAVLSIPVAGIAARFCIAHVRFSF